jgi:hypothetical protein
MAELRGALEERDDNADLLAAALRDREEEVATQRADLEERDDALGAAHDALAAAHAALDEARRDRSGDDDDRWSGWSGELDQERPEARGTSGDGETEAVVAWPASASGELPVHEAEGARAPQPRRRSRAVERPQAKASAEAQPVRTRSRWLQPDLLLGAVLIFIVLALGALLFFQVVLVVLTG